MSHFELLSPTVLTLAVILICTITLTQQYEIMTFKCTDYGETVFSNEVFFPPKPTTMVSSVNQSFCVEFTCCCYFLVKQHTGHNDNNKNLEIYSVTTKKQKWWEDKIIKKKIKENKTLHNNTIILNKILIRKSKKRNRHKGIEITWEENTRLSSSFLRHIQLIVIVYCYVANISYETQWPVTLVMTRQVNKTVQLHDWNLYYCSTSF